MFTRRTLLLAPIALTVAGCGKGGGGSATTPSLARSPAAPANEKFKVGLITAGTLSDGGWNRLAGDGLARLENELGAKPGHQKATKAEAEEALRGFARDGFVLVFAHGNEYQDAVLRVAQEYPDTRFVVSSGRVEAPNVASLRFELGEAAYLAGMAAAGLSKTGKAGQVGGEAFDPVKEAFAMFEQGGKAVNPSFSAPIAYVGNWSDANAAKEKALAMIRSGADVLFQNADDAGEGVFLAAEENPGVLVIGSNANQNEIKPKVIAASAVLDIPKTFMSIAKEVQAGTFKGQVYREDLASGNVYLALNPAFEERIPSDVRKKIDQAREEILSGKLRLTTG